MAVDKLKYEILLSVYGRMQHEMVQVGLVDDDTGRVLKVKNLSLSEQDGVKIYSYIFDQIKHLSPAQVKEYADRTNDIIDKLVNDKEDIINNYLISMLLYRNYLDEMGTGLEQNMMKPKVERNIELYSSFDGEEHNDIRRRTGRATDNIWRCFTGRAQLDDELRDKVYKRVRR